MASPTAAEGLFPERRILSVSDLNRAARGLLEGGFPLLWVEGEISNLARPASGHLYFSLKDSQAQVRCALFKNRGQLLRFKPADGMKVLVRGRVSLYEPRGDYQFIAEHLEEAGHGALQRAFDELKARLAKEGLFDPALKRPLPTVPRRIGVITSPSGAALHDILTVIRRRYPLARVILYPTPVQGEGAAAKIAAMIGTASARAECEVLILARGGGSLEDLWAFNEEPVARAIRACRIPLVSGVGHEIDFTIADFTADLRAPTPSGAAELVTPDSSEWQRRLAQREEQLHRSQLRLLQDLHRRLDWCSERLRQLHPSRILRDRSQRLDELQLRLGRCARTHLRHERSRLAGLQAALYAHGPLQQLRRASDQLTAFDVRLRSAARARMTQVANRLALSARALDAVSPLATLNRGYAIVSDAASGTSMSHVSAVRPGQTVHTRLADGTFTAEVKQVLHGEKK
ncbi:MAG TPA: exodeoxyribonuclease VII large subunit [Gammaproteobacteria bacterium]|jgi:exodeoxyribonuclease VII large subunit|nr:exodeoxyribonuclease VII large subunit [Gammaproteobacteria bacterium]